MLSAVWSTRRRRISALIAAVALIALGLPLVPGIGTKANADQSSVTVTGNWHRWLPDPTDAPPDPQPGDPPRRDDTGYWGQYDQNTTPTVTVSQTQDVTDQVVHVSWQNFTPSNDDPTYAVGPDGRVANVRSVQSGATLYPVIVLECGGAHPDLDPWLSSQSTCYNSLVGTPGEGPHGDSNAVAAPTNPGGSGEADFRVETAATNSLLGCDATHPCSIVVLPIQGGAHGNQNDLDGGQRSCTDHYNDFYVGTNYDQDLAATLIGGLQNDCSWPDRISVPLSFLPLAGSCPSSANAFNAEGSPMLTNGFGQWQSGWCHGTNPVSFSYNSTSDEYQARASFLSGGGAASTLTNTTDVALVSRPPDANAASNRKFTYAPVATNAITISAYVDNTVTGQPITDLRLDARLVAKLLTQSYDAYYWQCANGVPLVPGPFCAPEVLGNPSSILTDPEFQALNMGPAHPDHPDPSYFGDSSATALGQFFPTVVAGNSDLVFELTRWIASDPDAAAFLAGKPDPWGMHVNPYYNPAKTGLSYPLDHLQQSDPGYQWTSKDLPTARAEGGFQNTWNPISPYQQVAQRLVSGGTSALTNAGQCPGGVGDYTCYSKPDIPIKFGAIDSQSQGGRVLLAITDNSSATQYSFPAVGLVSPRFSTDGTLIDGGSVAVPTTSSMSAALSEMKTNPDGITQYVDHSVQDANAYPLTVVDYAMVPTCGLSSAKATGISSMLNHLASSQSYGVEPGTIAPGLLALDSKQLSQVKAAANAVSTQSCVAAPLDPNIKPDTPGVGSGGSTATTGSGGGSGGSGGSFPPADNAPISNPSGVSVPSSGGAVGPLSAGPSASSSTTTSPSASPAADAGFKPAGVAGTMSWVVPVMLLVGAVFLIGAPLTWFLTATTAGRSAIGRMRNLR